MRYHENIFQMGYAVVIFHSDYLHRLTCRTYVRVAYGGYEVHGLRRKRNRISDYRNPCRRTDIRVLPTRVFSPVRQIIMSWKTWKIIWNEVLRPNDRMMVKIWTCTIIIIVCAHLSHYWWLFALVGSVTALIELWIFTRWAKPQLDDLNRREAELRAAWANEQEKNSKQQ